jgi:uncharacterized membrane protein
MTEAGIESVPTTVRPQPPLISNHGLVVTVYILYLFGFLTAITALVGVIIAYLQQNNTDPVCQSHFRFQVRTFWIGLVYLVVGLLTIHIVIGAFVLLWWLIWTLMRCVKGLLALNTGEPIRNPNSWCLVRYKEASCCLTSQYNHHAAHLPLPFGMVSKSLV